MEEIFSEAEAIAVKGNKIIFVGDEEGALKFKSDHTYLIKAPDGMVLPGFIDSHVHLIWGGIEMGECQLSGLTSEKEIISKIETYVEEYSHVNWIRGNGWSLPIFKDGNPSRYILDKISTEKPMYFLSADGHSAWVNSKALSIAGLNENTRDPLNGRIERDAESRIPSGVLREDAMALVESLIPNYTKEQIDLQNHIISENKKAQSWIDVDPKNRWHSMITTDLNHWAKNNIFNVADYNKYMSANALYEIFSDSCQISFLRSASLQVGVSSVISDEIDLRTLFAFIRLSSIPREKSYSLFPKIP